MGHHENITQSNNLALTQNSESTIKHPWPPSLHAAIKALPVQPQPLPLPATAKLSLNSSTSRVPSASNSQKQEPSVAQPRRLADHWTKRASLASNSPRKGALEVRWNPCWAARMRKAIDHVFLLINSGGHEDVM